MRRPIALALAVALVAVSTASWGQAVPASASPTDDESWGEEDDWGEVDDDFGDLETAVVDVAPPSPWSVTGFARSSWGIWAERLETEPWSKGRQSLDLKATYKDGGLRAVAAAHGEYDLRYLHEATPSSAPHDDATLEAYQWQVLSREVFVSYAWERVDLTVGRQIVAWGEGDAFSPLDVVNPRDMREPGTADLEDIRLPILSTRFGFTSGPHRVELMGVHEADFGLRSPPFGPFSPLPALLADDPQAAALLTGKTLRYDDLQERFSLAGQQVLGRWVYKGPGIDLGVYGAWVLDRQGVITLPPMDAFVLSTEIDLPLDHRRYGLVGLSGAHAWGAWLLKWEAALEIDRPLNTFAQGLVVPEFGVLTTTMLQTMAGVSWTPEPELLFAVEVLKPFETEPLAGLMFEVDTPMVALRGSWKGWNDRLSIAGGVSVLGFAAEQGWSARMDATYEAVQSFFVSLGYVTFQPGDEFGFLSGLGTHDQLLARLRWDFTVY